MGWQKNRMGACDECQNSIKESEKFNYYNNKCKKSAFFFIKILVFQKKAVPLHRPNIGLN